MIKHSFWSKYLMIAIKCDVGFGNALFITGEKIGQWQRANRLHCVDGNEWAIHLQQADFANGAKFKFLIGPFKSGAVAEITPEFTYQSGCDRQLQASVFEMHDVLSLNDFMGHSNCTSQSGMKT